MKHTQKKELYIRQDALTDQLFDEHSIFLDIETTGFSPASSYVYLIGCAVRSGKYIYAHQFFAENTTEEQQILSAFLELLETYDTIISFNGVGFDVPYLKAKCDFYELQESFKEKTYLDIFKSISDLKFLLRLPNYKQKTIEKFLGIGRDDTQTGGELINVYREYIHHPSEEAEGLLHLHNYEDVIHMIDILPILSYMEIFNGQYTILSTRIDSYHAFDGTDGQELIITMQNDFPVPKRISLKQDSFYLMISKARTSIRVPVFDGELHYFYPNYKDYYYLPEEDMAVHKSVATYVDKDYRENAHASNCYTRKSGAFLPQYESIMQPEFREGYKDKISYFELTDDFCSSDIMIRRYIDHILKYISSPRKNQAFFSK